MSKSAKSNVAMAGKTEPEDNKHAGGGVSSHCCPFSDAVNRIVLAAEGRQVQTSNISSTRLFGDSDDGSCSDTEANMRKRKVSRRKEQHQNDGPLTAQELSQLGVLCSSVNSKGNSGNNDEKMMMLSWDNVDLDQLETLIAMLETQVVNASNADVVTSAFEVLTGVLNEDDDEVTSKKKLSIERWLTTKNSPETTTTNDARPGVGDGYRLLAKLRRGLESASILLSIMASCNNSTVSSRRCISEDTVEACLALFKQHLIKNIIPSLSETTPMSINNSHKISAKQEASDSKQPQKNAGNNEGSLLIQGRDQKLSKDSVKSSMRKVYKPILSTVGLLTLLMERIEALIQSTIQLDDRPILAITSSALATFPVDPPVSSSSDNVASIAHAVQVAAMRLITSVVRRYPRHRPILMEDLFPLMLKLPTSRRSLRTYPLRVAKSISSSSSSNRKHHAMAALSYGSTFCPLPSSATSPLPAHVINTGCIQVMTALILGIIQCFVVKPQPEDFEEDERQQSSRAATKKIKEQWVPKRYTSGLIGCYSACSFLATQLTQRCSKKCQDGGASEFRPYLSNFIDDLLLVQLFPEYPAANMILMAFCRKLSSDLLRCKQEGAPTLEVTYMAIAMETLGKICAATAGQLRCNRESPLALPQPVGSNDESPVKADSAPINNDNEVNRCFCERINLVETYMLDCDQCHGWFHASCVGIARGEVPNYWVCDECKMHDMIIEQTELLAAACRRPGNRSFKVDETHVFRQLLLNHLTFLAAGIPDAIVGREFLLAKWVDQFQSEKDSQQSQNAVGFDSDIICAYFLDQWTLAVPIRKSGGGTQMISNADNGQLSEEGNSRIVRALAAKSSELASSFPNLLGVVVKLMEDESANALRKLAVKAIAQVVQVDPSLMLQPSLRQAVARRFLDGAISVREAAVSLVGCYVLQDPKVANAFHSSLIARLGDVGVSVRKKVVRLFRDLLISQPGYSGRVDVCSSMLQRASNPREEEALRDEIKAMFKELWFYEEAPNNINISTDRASISSDIAQESCTQDLPMGNTVKVSNDEVCDLEPDETASYAPISKPRRKNAAAAKRKQQRCREIVAQMVDVVAVSKDTGFLEKMVKDQFLVSENEKDTKKLNCDERKATAEDHCLRLVSALIEELLQFEERRGRSTQPDGDARLVSIVSTIGIFCEAAPGLLAPHIDTLLPYLKADNLLSADDESKILTIICRLIIQLVSSALPLADVHRLASGTVANDLAKITHKFGSAASSAAVEALAMIARRTGLSGDQETGNDLMKLARTFYGYLHKVKDMTNDYSTTASGVQSNLKRALSVLGSICQYHETDQHSFFLDKDLMVGDDPTTFPFLQPSLFSWCNLSNACFAAFSFYSGKEDALTKCAALNAMTGIFLARPRVMLAIENKGVIANFLSKDSHPLVQLEALRCWKNILSAEEWRVESGQARERMDQNAEVTLSKRISGDQDGDSSIAGSVLTQHTSRIYQLMKSAHAAIRLAAVDLIGLLLRQGLINPMETVPHLLALQGDVKSPTIRRLALQLLVREGEKRPDMLRQRVCAGVREAYLFQREIIPHNEQVTAITFESDEFNGTVKVECIFGLLYKECLSSNKVLKQALFKSLIMIFVSSDFAGESANTASVSDVNGAHSRSSERELRKEAPRRGLMRTPESTLDLPLLCYASQILAHLPYNASMDPLFVIHHVSNAIAIHGEPLLDHIARFLSPHLSEIGEVEDGEYDNNNLEEDVIEKAAKSKAPLRTKAAKLLENPNFDLWVFSQLCTKAASIVLLIRLKQFLRKVYSLSETRCIEYTPSDKDKVGDKSINIPEVIPVFNNKFDPFIQDSSGNKCHSPSSTPKKDGLIHVYAEFRRLMRFGSGSVKGKTTEDKPKNGEMVVAPNCQASPKGGGSQSSPKKILTDDSITGNDTSGEKKVVPKRPSSSKRAASQASSKRKRKE